LKRKSPQVSATTPDAGYNFPDGPKYTYSFNSEVGTFWIRQERDQSWSLSIGKDIIEEISYFSSAFEPADNVHMQTTGWDE
jgi:hypothetical protein